MNITKRDLLKGVAATGLLAGASGLPPPSLPCCASAAVDPPSINAAAKLTTILFMYESSREF